MLTEQKKSHRIPPAIRRNMKLFRKRWMPFWEIYLTDASTCQFGGRTAWGKETRLIIRMTGA